MENMPAGEGTTKHAVKASKPAFATGRSASRTGRYLKYSIGEIVLVVIGILIALQINNWNEKRKEQKKQHFILNVCKKILPPI